MKGMMVFAVLVLLVGAGFAIQTQYNSQLSWHPTCGGSGGWALDTLRVAPSPGDVVCGAGDTFYYCVDVVKLNTSVPGNTFGGAGDVTPGTGYFDYVYVDFIGRTVANGEVLQGSQDRNAPKNLWRPRVLVKRLGGTCYNWNYLNFNVNSPSNLIGYLPAGNNASGQIGGFYLTNDTVGVYVPTAMDGAVADDGGDMPSGEVMSDAGILMKEVGATLPDYAGIRVYNQGYAGSWAFKPGDSSFDMMFYKWTTWTQFQIVPMPFTTERGTYFGHNPVKSRVSFDIIPVMSKPVKKK